MTHTRHDANFNSLGQNGDHYRYYIVLQPGGGPSPRQQQQARRGVAAEFVALLHEWVAEKNLQAQVSAVDITLFGQILITCAPEFIEHIRGQDMLAIAEIRPAQQTGQHLRRLLDQFSG